MVNKETVGEVEVIRDEAVERISAIQGFYDKAFLERMKKQTLFNNLSDVEVEEMVPRFNITVPRFYLHKGYDYENGSNFEYVFGFYWTVLFTLGKKKQKRFLHTWELPKDKQKNSVIKFKRYGNLSADTKPLDK